MKYLAWAAIATLVVGLPAVVIEGIIRDRRAARKDGEHD